LILITRGFLIEHGVCSNDIWIADHELGYQIGDAGYSNFFVFLAKVSRNVWDDEKEMREGRGRGSVGSSRFERRFWACRA